jgi:hypothetical protein
MIRFLSVYHPATIFETAVHFYASRLDRFQGEKKARVAGFIITSVIQTHSTSGHRG